MEQGIKSPGVLKLSLPVVPESWLWGIGCEGEALTMGLLDALLFGAIAWGIIAATREPGLAIETTMVLLYGGAKLAIGIGLNDVVFKWEMEELRRRRMRDKD